MRAWILWLLRSITVSVALDLLTLLLLQMNVAIFYLILGSLVSNDLPLFLGRTFAFFTAVWLTTQYFNVTMITIRETVTALITDDNVENDAASAVGLGAMSNSKSSVHRNDL